MGVGSGVEVGSGVGVGGWVGVGVGGVRVADEGLGSREGRVESKAEQHHEEKHLRNAWWVVGGEGEWEE